MALRVAIYLRVSSDEQADKGTIETQRQECRRWLEHRPEFVHAGEYPDDGVSGMIPLPERPGGAHLMRDAAAGAFDAVLVYKVDRLGRDAVDLLVIRRRFDALGIRLLSVVEGEPDLLGYDVQAVVADHYRREFLRKTADGLNRAAREGRYSGGIVAYGYGLAGERGKVRPVPDDRPICGDLSAADVVRLIYHWIGLEGWSCVRAAIQLNAMGVPTHYQRDGRGLRGKATQGLWRAGRVGNLVHSTFYKGEARFGKRTKKPDREIIVGPVERLVTDALWQAAQESLARNRVIPKNTRRLYLLRSVIRCATDGLTFTGTQGRPGECWYRCDGKTIERGPLQGKCPSRLIRGEWLEALIWADVEAFLRHPGEILAELEREVEGDAVRAVAEAESITLTRALEDLDHQRARALDTHVRGRLTVAEVDAILDRIAAERAQLEGRLAVLEPSSGPEPLVPADLLGELRQRLAEGLTIEQRQEIVRLLVQVVVHTDIDEQGRKQARLLVTYRLPDVAETCSRMGVARPFRVRGPAVWNALPWPTASGPPV